jgi:hypothetical protein
MGGLLGSQTMDAERRTRLDAGTYAFGLCVAAQPARLGWLINHEEMQGGLPQRFLFAPAAPAYMPEWTAPAMELTFAMPFEATPMFEADNVFGSDPEPKPRRELVIVAPDEVMQYIRVSSRERRFVGTSDGMAHVDLTRLKVAGILAIMDGRTDMTNQDWELAGYVVRMSMSMVDWVWAKLKVDNQKVEDARAKGRARSRSIEERAYDDISVKADIEKVVTKIAAKPGMTSSELLQTFKSNRRDDAQVALDQAIEDGLVLVTKGTRRGQDVDVLEVAE